MEKEKGKPPAGVTDKSPASITAQRATPGAHESTLKVKSTKSQGAAAG